MLGVLFQSQLYATSGKKRFFFLSAKGRTFSAMIKDGGQCCTTKHVNIIRYFACTEDKEAQL
jgi:hypothetical protein